MNRISSKAPALPLKTGAELYKIAMRTAVLSLIGFFFSRGEILGQFSPLGAAFAAALPVKSSLLPILAILTGTFIPGAGSLKYMTAVAAVAGLKWVLSGMPVTKYKLFAPAITFVSLLTAGLFLSSSGGIGNIITALTESILAAGAAYFIEHTLDLISRPDKMKSVGVTDYGCIILSAGLLFACTEGITFAGIAPARIIAAALILAASYNFKIVGGCIAGACAGIALSLGAEGMTHLAGAYAFAGLLSGMFMNAGKLSSALSFVAANAIVAVAVGGSPQIYAGLYEAALGSVIFMILPDRVLSDLAKIFPNVQKSPEKSAAVEIRGTRRAVSGRLGFAAAALGEVSNAVNTVSQRLSTMTGTKKGMITARVKET